mgnify:CR=1 FL=1
MRERRKERRIERDRGKGRKRDGRMKRRLQMNRKRPCPTKH